MKAGQIALVTGAATGIGKACAIHLARAGYRVMLNYRSREQEAQAMLKQLAGEGHQALAADVSDPAQASRLLQQIDRDQGRLDVLVNAAGIFANQDIVAGDFEAWQASWQQVMQTNLMGPVNLAFAAAKLMIPQGSGKIINITSRGAFRGEPTAPAYGASKSALNSASQSLAVALAPHGIQVYAIAPGWVDTPMAAPRIFGANQAAILADIPLGRPGHVDEIAGLATYLASGETAYLTGAIIDANGASYLRN
ncbi:MAG: SDR family oxidoreductase [Pseudomonadales bacterium]|nr:SDR family oxidoreductase [Pseudomonadales bacterium]